MYSDVKLLNTGRMWSIRGKERDVIGQSKFLGDPAGRIVISCHNEHRDSGITKFGQLRDKVKAGIVGFEKTYGDWVASSISNGILGTSIGSLDSTNGLNSGVRFLRSLSNQ